MLPFEELNIVNDISIPPKQWKEFTRFKPDNSKDLTNVRFGKLIALEKDFSKNRLHWKCQCDCGNTILVRSTHLLSGAQKACGCNRWNPDAGLNERYKVYIKGALKRKIKFELSLEEFKELISGNCVYCGDPPNQLWKGRKYHYPIKYNGIDRVNSSLPYQIDNCVSCCGFCNLAKQKKSREEFEAWINRLVAFRNKNASV